jgi:hypothetical protein
MNKSDGQIYDFCMEWMMNFTPRKPLCKKFVDENFNFFQFKEVADNHGWFVNSMYALLYAEEFSK